MTPAYAIERLPGANAIAVTPTAPAMPRAVRHVVPASSLAKSQEPGLPPSMPTSTRPALRRHRQSAHSALRRDLGRRVRGRERQGTGERCDERRPELHRELRRPSPGAP